MNPIMNAENLSQKCILSTLKDIKEKFNKLSNMLWGLVYNKGQFFPN